MMNNIEKRIKVIEEKIKELEVEKRNLKSADTGMFSFSFLFFILLPVEVPLYALFAVGLAIMKPFMLPFLTEKEKKMYELEGEFNPFEYMWSSITPRGPSEEKSKKGLS